VEEGRKRNDVEYVQQEVERMQLLRECGEGVGRLEWR